MLGPGGHLANVGLKILSRITAPTKGRVELHGRGATCSKSVLAFILNSRGPPMQQFQFWISLAPGL